MTPVDKGVIVFAALILILGTIWEVRDYVRERRRRREARELRVIDRAVRRDINTGSWS